MSPQSAKSKGKARAVDSEPAIPSSATPDALEGNLRYIHHWVEGLYNRLVARFTDEAQMWQEFADHAALLNDLRNQLNRFQGKSWVIPGLQLIASVSSLADEWGVPMANWRMGPTESASLLELFGTFNFDNEPPVQYMPDAPRPEMLSSLPSQVHSRAAISSAVAGPSRAVDSSNAAAGCSNPLSKRKAPESPMVESSRPKRSKIVKASANRVTFAESSDEEASEPPKFYRTRSRARQAPVATSESEAAATDRPSRQKSSKTNKRKGKAKRSTENTEVSVDELWTSGARSHVFPEEWVGAARTMELQFDLGEAKLSLESILKAGRSVAFFNHFTPCGRCTYFGYTDCKPIWAASGKTGRRPTCARCFSGKQKCSYFDPDDSRSGLKKLEAASSNHHLLAKIALRLHRELQAYDDLRIAQMAAYKASRSVWENIQESQRMLRAAGRDPVEVFKGLSDDEDFQMTPSQVKALGEALGWSLSGSATEEVEENAPPSIPLLSSSINPPAPIAGSGIFEKVSEAEEEGDDEDSSDSSSGPSSPSANAVSAVAESATVQEEAEVPQALRSDVEVTVKDLIDDEAEEASTEDSSDGEETNEEKAEDWEISTSDLEGLSPVARAVMEKLARERLAYEKAFGRPMYRKRA
ncbi:hypothetical protein E1B28_012618 [Marasmius oreades]|uniref:Uncharacterized protein n=1 Tax=Marasmius oreades TaxID=181124 RepID=A0A9P7RRU7_9AGAR|nr:uncharacterized protein E1B28_012618 [Marasmius oreades]KAG7088646.1 hypothetical protein E1B28_012618 [Marasmius oreades]